MNQKYKFEFINNIYLRIFLIYIMSRILYIFQYGFISKLINYPMMPNMNVFLNWDSKIYLDIITNGYLPNAQFPVKYAFFPFYPMYIKCISFILHTNPVITGVIINQITLLFSLIVLYKYMTKLLHFNAIHAEFSIFLLAISSVNTYLNILYTESTFILLLLLAFYNLRSNNYWRCAMIAGILSMTKVVGVLFMIPFFIHSYNQHSKLIRWQLIIQLGIIGLGLLLFMAYLFKASGDPIAFVHAQAHWGRMTNVDWLHHPINSLASLIHYARPHELMFFALYFAITIFLIFKRSCYLENIYLSSAVGVIILSGKLENFTRYMLVHFIVYIALGYAANYKSRVLSYFIILFFGIFSFGLLLYFIQAT